MSKNAILKFYLTPIPEKPEKMSEKCQFLPIGLDIDESSRSLV
jgi:hypothetical protein